MSKSVKDLTNSLEQWRLGDSKDLGVVTQTVFNQLENCDTSTQKEALKFLELKTAECKLFQHLLLLLIYIYRSSHLLYYYIFF